MTIVRTDLGDTREVAKRLRFESTPSIPATNVQDAIEAAAASSSAPAPITITATQAIPATAVTVRVNAAGAVTVTLPDSAIWAGLNEQYAVPLSVFDVSGAAQTNNITIDTTGGETINGGASVTIDSDFGAYRFQPNPLGGWTVV